MIQRVTVSVVARANFYISLKNNGIGVEYNAASALILRDNSYFLTYEEPHNTTGEVWWLGHNNECGTEGHKGSHYKYTA